MPVDRFSFTMDAELGSAVRESAARANMSVSTWLAEAAADRLRNDLLGRALDQWESEEGALSDDELDVAAAKLGIDRRPRVPSP